MDPIVVRADISRALPPVLGALGLAAVLLVLGLVWEGVVVAVVTATVLYSVGRRAVVASDAGIHVRNYMGTDRYTWSRVAGVDVAELEGQPTARIRLVTDETVWIPMWTDPDRDTIRQLDDHARERHA